MNAPVKYLFDTKLDAPAAPPPVAFSEVENLKSEHADELARLRTEAFEQGRIEGQKEAEQSLERELSNALNQLIEEKDALQSEFDTKLHAAQTSSVFLAMNIAKKLASSLLDKYPQEHIENFFREALALLPDKTSLRLHVEPKLAPVLQPRLQELLERNGQENALQTIEDETITGVNCRLTWLDGGIEQDTDHLFSLIEKMIEDSFHLEAVISETKTKNEPERPIT